MTSDTGALQQLNAFIFDMDGVIYRGSRVLPGAAQLVERLRRCEIPHLFLTNNSTTPAVAVAERLQAMGIPASADDILTSADATAEYLVQEMPGCSVLVVGEEGIREALRERGFALTTDHRGADAVVAGMDRQATYDRLKEASLALQAGARFVATNLDANLPSEEGLIPGAGSIVGLLEIASGVKAHGIGKPAPGIFRQALARLCVAPEVTAAIGDRAETDILGGQAAGLKTIAVLTGVGSRADFDAMRPPPDWIFEDLPDFERASFGA